MATRILILEDEKPIARALQLKLQNEGFEVEVAGDGEAGIKAVTASKFNLIIADLMMPVSDGFDFLKKLAEQKIDIPVIVTSNLSQQEDRERALALGAKEYFVKSNTAISDIIKKIRLYAAP